MYHVSCVTRHTSGTRYRVPRCIMYLVSSIMMYHVSFMKHHTLYSVPGIMHQVSCTRYSVRCYSSVSRIIITLDNMTTHITPCHAIQLHISANQHIFGFSLPFILGHVSEKPDFALRPQAGLGSQRVCRHEGTRKCPRPGPLSVPPPAPAPAYGQSPNRDSGFQRV